MNLNHPVQSITFCSTPSFVTNSEKGFSVWKDGIEEPWFTHKEDGITAIAFYDQTYPSDKNYVALATKSPLLRIYEVDPKERQKGRKILRLRGHNEIINSIVFSTDSKEVLSGSEDKTAILWQIKKGLFGWRSKKRVYDFFQDPIKEVAMSNDSKLLAAATANHEVFLWDKDANEYSLALRLQSEPKQLMFTNNGYGLFVMAQTQVMYVDLDTMDAREIDFDNWNIDKGRMSSKDDSNILVAADEKTTRIYKLDNDKSKELGMLKLESDEITSFAIDSNQHFLSIARNNRKIMMYDLHKILKPRAEYLTDQLKKRSSVQFAGGTSNFKREFGQPKIDFKISKMEDVTFRSWQPKKIKMFAGTYTLKVKISSGFYTVGKITQKILIPAKSKVIFSVDYNKTSRNQIFIIMKIEDGNSKTFPIDINKYRHALRMQRCAASVAIGSSAGC
eukprot:CAMPEP_0184489974 /NCGR_PEP_ID=MMETSP0113_2-20130426/16806_1 /TAXON_ID=91329 /ORGANISM="Norrisiella sphaerica, Strain BC52" /LENGTH=446 /DNA_ID=CAMNT_0026873673 /DNA_START=55 /DNA_END=1395 /DNA_ORIENTATION=+